MSDLFGNEEIRALTWKQPYGLLMMAPHNKIETRTWRTRYRGKVLMCAGKIGYHVDTIMELSGEKQYERIMERVIDKPMIFGQAFAVGDLIDCRRMTPADEDLCFVAYNPDLYCHVYSNVRAIEPFDWKGMQGLTKVHGGTCKIKFIL